MASTLAAAAALLWLALTFIVTGEASSDYDCPATADAIAALQSNANVSVHYTQGIGYAFESHVPVLFLGRIMSTITGVVVIPEKGVAPAAYAPLARALALAGSYAVVVEKPGSGRVISAMLQKPQAEIWALVGHGRSGGALAARLAITLEPKVKALILMAASMPPDVNMTALNVLVVALYGLNDTVITPESVQKSFPRFPGDSLVTSFPNLGHYDFAKSKCVGNEKLGQDKESQPLQGATDQDFQSIVALSSRAFQIAHWFGASKKALSFSDNERLTPGRNVSKVYPGNIRVQYSAIPAPNTNPQRFWWVFTPTVIKGGLVYYPGAAVDARAYFQLAFEIAARGHLVVIVEMPMRIASYAYQDANVVIASKNPLLSVVPKGKWAIAGHSLGGAAATQYVGEFGDRIYAAVMHAGGWAVNLTENPLPIDQIYGTLDDLTPGGYDRYRYGYTDPPPKGIGPLVNLKTTRFVPIKGANHYQMGDYGYQSPDEIPTISLEQQAATVAHETVSFLNDVASGKPVAQNTPRSDSP